MASRILQALSVQIQRPKSYYRSQGKCKLLKFILSLFNYLTLCCCCYFYYYYYSFLLQREVNIESLNEGDTFVLDVGKRLYLWFGKQSNKHERAKGEQFAYYLAEQELGGVPVTVVKDKDTCAFLNIFIFPLFLLLLSC